MKKILLFSFTFFLVMDLMAQVKQGSISAIVSDDKQQPVEFASVVLERSVDSSLVKGALTDETGKFIFENIDAGKYILLIAHVSFKKYTDVINHDGNSLILPSIKLEQGTVNVKEVSIEATRPFIEHRIDRTIVNVENSIVNSGSTVLEILKRSPGVTVDNNDNISLKGKQGVLVMIDGKPTYLSSTDLATTLKNMRADELSQIELITNPSAKYDAAGNSGIINIKLRKKQNLGFNGSFTTSYGQGVYPDFQTGVSLNYRKEKFNVFGSYYYGQNFYFEKNKLVRRFHEPGYTSVFDQHTFDKAKSENNNAKAGFDYFINSKHTIGFLAKGNFFNSDDKTVSTTEIKNFNELVDSGYTTINNNNSIWNNFSFNLNHQFKIDTLGRELTADLDYANYDNGSDYHFETNHFSPSPSYTPFTDLEKNNQLANVNIKAVKVDYTQPILKKYKFETGLKSSYVITDNDVKYYNIINSTELIDTGKTNHFKYTENINALYVNLSGEFKKFGVQAGLRVEQTIAVGKQLTTSLDFTNNYVQLFPSVFFSYKLNEKNQFGLNYSRRIDRPAYQQLNPFRYFLDPNTYQEGNPNLQPQLTNSFEFSHTFMNVVTTSINYSHTTQAMTDITKQIDSTRTTFVTTENFDAHDNYGLSVSIPFPVTKWWQTSNNINVFNNKFTGVISGSTVEKRLTAFFLNTDNSFSLPYDWSLELSAYYNSRMVYATFLIDPQYSVSGGFAKSFFQRRLKLKIDMNDIFKTEKSFSKVQYDNIDYDFSQLHDTQFVRFHLTYNFGKKTVEQARRRRLGAEEEQSRVRTGN